MSAPLDLDQLLRLLRAQIGQAQQPALTVQQICTLFLAWSVTHNKANTFTRYREYLDSFCGHEGAGQLEVASLRPHHVTAWVDAHPTWQGSRRAAIVAVKRACNWAVDEGHILSSPLKLLRKPASRCRQRVLEPHEKQMILAHYPASDPFHDYVFALFTTGARPGEVAAVERCHVSFADCCWRFEQHKTADRLSEPRPRVVMLTPKMLDLTRRLVARHKTGPLFRNQDGQPWTRNAVRCRFRRLRTTLGLEGVCAYTARHTWITDALERGVPDATVAELVGHVNTEMIHRHYNHLRSRKKHLKEMAAKAAGE